VDERAAARYLGVSVAWLRKRRLDRQPPRYRKFCSLVRYAIDDLDKYAASSEVATGNEAPLTAEQLPAGGE